jgi:hypothetical protein
MSDQTNPFGFMSEVPISEPSAVKVETSPLGPPKPSIEDLQRELEEARRMLAEKTSAETPAVEETTRRASERGGPTHREDRADPRPRERHRLRPVSEMAEMQESTPLHIDPKDFPDQFDLQWVTSEVFGQPTNRRMRFEQRGWESVHGDDFDGRYDGRFMPAGHNGEIKMEGMVLMARPKAWSNKARQEDQRAAQQAVRVKADQLGAGQIPGVTGADHPSALRSNYLRKQVGRLEVPPDIEHRKAEGIID